MPDDSQRLEHLLELRAELFQEMEDADREFSRVRMQLERLESDVRCGLPEPPDLAEYKNRKLHQAEARVLDLVRDLWKLEDKIHASRR